MNCPYHETGKPMQDGKYGKYCPNRGSGTGDKPPSDSGYCQYNLDKNGNVKGVYAETRPAPAAAPTPPMVASVALQTMTNSDARLTAAIAALKASAISWSGGAADNAQILGRASEFYHAFLMPAYNDALPHPAEEAQWNN